MGLSTGTFDFTLHKPIIVAINGQDIEATELTFHECGEGYDGYYMKLRRLIKKSQLDAAKLLPDIKAAQEASKENLASGEELKALHEKDDLDHDDDTEGMIEFIKMVAGVGDGLEEIVKIFGYMVSNSGSSQICSHNGVRIKEAAWKRVHIEDKIDAAVKYCAFFGIGLDRPESKPSDNLSVLHTGAKEL